MTNHKIAKITGDALLDSRGFWTVEATLTLENGVRVRASVPQGKSTGTHEAHAVSAPQAVRAIENVIAPRLEKKDPRMQKMLDAMMTDLDGTLTKKKLGANAILAVSVAVARAGAVVAGVPLWKHLRSLLGGGVAHVHSKPPRLFVNVINGGLHAGNGLRFQEYMIIPQSPTIRKSVEMATTFYHALGEYLAKAKGKGANLLGDEGGFAPHFKDDTEPFEILSKVRKSLGMTSSLDFGLDAAASSFKATPASLHAWYEMVEKKFKLRYLEDPFPEESFNDFTKLHHRFKEKVWLAGDDLTTTNVLRMERALQEDSVNAVIIKPNQIGTVTESLNAVRHARRAEWAVVASHRSGETNDGFIADFAYGVGADGIKLGAPARGERIEKYNRLLEIERSET